jgi:glycosyltransferase involved in cell wall biosynthesis
VTETLPPGTYDNVFEFDNVYGHALDLLVRHRSSAPADGVHLDLGCGYGRIAEPLVAALGLKYIGCDIDPAGLRSLGERGFETHNLPLGAEEETYAALRDCVAGRPLVSISMLDTLEHLPDTAGILRALSRLAQDSGSLVVLSAPNAAHFDIGAKLLLGRLDITDVGILDHTHMRTFSAGTLDRELRAAGLYPFDEFDTQPPVTDQHFPPDHPFLKESTEIGGLLRDLRRTADPKHADVLQLVRICAPGPIASEARFLKAYAAEERPFLTALIRTRGRRIHTLRETLVCLNGQTDLDIEILVVGHRLEPDAIKIVERALDDQPEEMRLLTRFIRVEDGNRVRPLNVGFAEARGHYITILDDDDIPMGNWVETFRELDRRAPGRVLRTACVRQSVRTIVVQDLDGLRAEGPPETCYDKNFDLISHLRSNESPPICLAFPRGAFHDLGIRFDEMMTTTEDWDYLMRVALLVGVESSTARTGVYRWWTEGESSRTDHPQSEWHRNYDAIMRKLDSRPLLLPVGAAAQLRELLGHRSTAHRLAAENRELQAAVHGLRTEFDNLRAMVAGSLTLRLARLIPKPLRTFVRRIVRSISRLLKGN